MFYLSHSSPLILFPSFIQWMFENCAFPFDSPIRSLFTCNVLVYFPHWTLCGCILTLYQSNMFGESFFRLPDNSFHFIILIVQGFVSLYDVRCVSFSLFFFSFRCGFFCKQNKFHLFIMIPLVNATLLHLTVWIWTNTLGFGTHCQWDWMKIEYVKNISH